MRAVLDAGSRAGSAPEDFNIGTTSNYAVRNIDLGSKSPLTSTTPSDHHVDHTSFLPMSNPPLFHPSLVKYRLSRAILAVYVVVSSVLIQAWCQPFQVKLKAFYTVYTRQLINGA
jgi:hypothetical protein